MHCRTRPTHAGLIPEIHPYGIIGIVEKHGLGICTIFQLIIAYVHVNHAVGPAVIRQQLFVRPHITASLAVNGVEFHTLHLKGEVLMIYYEKFHQFHSQKEVKPESRRGII